MSREPGEEQGVSSSLRLSGREAESQHRGELRQGLSLMQSLSTGNSVSIISGVCVGLGQEGPCAAAVTAIPCCHCHPSSAW